MAPRGPVSQSRFDSAVGRGGDPEAPFRKAGSTARSNTRSAPRGCCSRRSVTAARSPACRVFVGLERRAAHTAWLHGASRSPSLRLAVAAGNQSGPAEAGGCRGIDVADMIDFQPQPARASWRLRHPDHSRISLGQVSRASLSQVWVPSNLPVTKPRRRRADPQDPHGRSPAPLPRLRVARLGPGDRSAVSRARSHRPPAARARPRGHRRRGRTPDRGEARRAGQVARNPAPRGPAVPTRLPFRPDDGIVVVPTERSTVSEMIAGAETPQVGRVGQRRNCHALRPSARVARFGGPLPGARAVGTSRALQLSEARS
jgi:hypothetical protein